MTVSKWMWPLTLSLSLSPWSASPVVAFGFGVGNSNSNSNYNTNKNNLPLVVGSSSQLPSSPTPPATATATPPLTLRRLSPSSSSSCSSSSSATMSRQSFFVSTAGGAFLSLSVRPSPALALVKGNAPPPPKTAPADANDPAKKCRNVEECQERAERAEALRLERERERLASGKGPKAGVAEGGVRYLDVSDEDDDEEGVGAGRAVAKGDAIEIYYKVLKLGKRSYDGLSGEGTVIFSRGYGLEDDEKEVGDRSFVFTVGDADVIEALNEGVVGMTLAKEGAKGKYSKRRISIPPQKGWEKSTPQCDGGPGGSGAGGELRTDYVVVPTATMVEQEACFDKAKRPFPGTYAQERRMAQRFDQSLIVEVVLVDIKK
ncbi:hypothetical protein ACHAXS_001936 [Conticribra weissflogii]